MSFKKILILSLSILCIVGCATESQTGVNPSPDSGEIEPVSPDVETRALAQAIYLNGRLLNTESIHLATLKTGQFVTASQHKVSSETDLKESILVFSGFSKSGQLEWTQAYEVDQYFTLGSFIEQEAGFYFSGTTLEVEGALRPGNSGKLNLLVGRIDHVGQIDWQHHFNLGLENVSRTRDNRVLRVGENELGITHNGVLYLLDTSGKILKQISADIQSMIKTPDGGYLLDTKTNYGLIQVSKLDAGFQYEWVNNYATELKGIEQFSDIFSVAEDRYFKAFSVNDLSNTNAIGVGHFIFNGRGEVISSGANTAVATVDGKGIPLLFSGFKGSRVAGDNILISAMHTSGALGSNIKRFMNTLYAPDGEVVASYVSSFEKPWEQLDYVGGTWIGAEPRAASIGADFSYKLLFAGNPAFCSLKEDTQMSKRADYTVSQSPSSQIPKPIENSSPPMMKSINLSPIKVDVTQTAQSCDGE